MPISRRGVRPVRFALCSLLTIGAVGCGSRSAAPPPPVGMPPLGLAATSVPSRIEPGPAPSNAPVSAVASAPTTLHAAMIANTMSETTIHYGGDPAQFGVLYLPATTATTSTTLPVVVLIHGGFWRASYGLDLMVPLAQDLVARGVAVWNIEYRRVGQTGGGWPGTLEDAAAAIDQLAVIARSVPLDLARVAVVGHSAGGQLALWAAGRGSLPAGSPGAAPAVVPVLAIGQGPVGDLVAGDRDQLGGGAVTDLLGGTSSEHPDRYAVATPSTATTARLVVVRGDDDTTVPADYTLPPDHDAITVVDVPGEDHFDLIDPASAAWARVVAAVTTI